MAKHTFAIFHFSATASLLASSILLILVSLSGGIWRDFSLLTVDLKNGSQFEIISFSRDRDSYATYGTFNFCIQNIDMGNGYQKQSCSDPTVGYPITEVQTAIDGTKFFANNKKLDGLTKVMILHPIVAVTCFLACIFSIRSGYLRSVAAMGLTLLSWMLITIAMSIELYLFVIVHEHVTSKEVGGGSRCFFGAALWSLVVAFILLTFATLVMSATVWQGKYWWRGKEVRQNRVKKRRATLARGVDGEVVSSTDSSPVRRWSRDENHHPFWRHRTDREALVFE
ncbi:hypothetical protein H072_609 [Dactylellina haptotyla CBS 200.50]|uniref:MARVEL domain-containing protein n=1 Tax=Dactylellina haptotyla (strain CBS 200.50) TaxID=1284197 RepID=S8AWU1_DACHA|nr:hypothetical protein H072_609 [Dactylellina haptotyla CBS 200.50]